MRLATERGCARCGTPFTDRTKPQNQRFCSANCRKRAFAAALENRVPCVTCGGPTAGTPGQHRASARPEGERECQACWLTAEHARVAERGHRIEEWWAQGLTLRQIAARLDWTVGHLAQEQDRLRKKGFDLPYRYRTYRGKELAA